VGSILRLLVARFMTAHCTYSRSAAGFPLKVARRECGQTALWRPEHLLLAHQIHHMRLSRVGDVVLGAALTLMYSANKAILRMPNSQLAPLVH
jgi:hypothetical protein